MVIELHCFQIKELNMNTSNPLSSPDLKHGRAVDADTDDNALVASGPQPKHGAAAALSVGAAGAAAEGTIEPESGSQEANV
jgi:hypothetical protein